MPRGIPHNRPRPINADLSNPFVLRAVLEMPINRPDVFVRTTLQRYVEGYVPGEELWEEYRLWAHRTPMSESSFLAELEKVGHSIAYGNDHEWYLNGWQWTGTAPVKLTGKNVINTDRPVERSYTFTSETLSPDKLKAVALLCVDHNGIAESIGWPARKFALYRVAFPHVERAIERVWKENPDRFKQEIDVAALTPRERHRRIASARSALNGAKARGNDRQIESAKVRINKLQGKG